MAALVDGCAALPMFGRKGVILPKLLVHPDTRAQSLAPNDLLASPEGLAMPSMGMDVKTNQSTRSIGVASDGRCLESRQMVEAREVVRQGASRIHTGWRLPHKDPSQFGIEQL